MVIFQENVYKRDYRDVFSGKRFKRDFLQKQIYGKDSESLPFFFNKDIEISKQSFIKQKSILLFLNKDIEFSKQKKFYLNNKKSIACSFRG